MVCRAANLFLEYFRRARLMQGGLLRGQRLTDDLIAEIAEAYASSIEPLSDLRGSDWYRKQIIGVLARRALKQALASS